MASTKVHSISLNASLSQVKALIIEDNDDHWFIMNQVMQATLPELTPVRVASPEAALGWLAEWQYQEWEIPKLIVLDLYLPQAQDGWALLGALKALSAPLNQIPILMLSASSSLEDVRKGHQLGVSAYLIKPSNPQAWSVFFGELRAYWWETVSLPPLALSR